MAKYAFTSIQRMAIWKAHKSKCAYCGELIFFKDLEIDHILPESLLGNSDKLERTKLEYGLDSEFDINSYYNWIPSCKSCNKRKSNRPFSESSARFYIEMVARPRYEEIRRLEQNLERTMKKEGFLTKTQAISLIKYFFNKQQSYDSVDTSKLPSFSVKEDVLDRETTKNEITINALQQDGRNDGAYFSYEGYQMDTAVNLKPDVGVDIYFRNVGKENIKINEIISVVFNLDNEECPAPKKFPLIDCECRGDGTFSQPLLIPATQLARYAIAIKLKYQGTISLSKSKSKTFLFLHQGGTLLHPLLGQQQNWNPLFTQATNASDYQQIKARLPKDFHE